MPRKEDIIRIRHMIQAGNEALAILKGRTREDFEREIMLRHSVLHCIEIVGGAASRVSKETQEKYPSVPWRKIVNMRNRIIHVYFDVNHDMVWRTAVDALPPLLAALNTILRDESSGQ